MPIHSHRRRAFTMIELIVVLSILAVLTTVAVQSLEPVGKQARVDATHKTLAEFRAAVVGRSPSDDGQTSAACFVADMGRLPTSVDELFFNVNNIPEFQTGSLAADNADVTIGRGWRGPYMRLPAGATQLRDGWGNFFAYDVSNGLAMESRGDDATDDLVRAPIDTYGVDVGFHLPATGAVDSYYGESITGVVLELVSGQWVAPTSNSGETIEVEVTLFTPDPTVLPDADGVAQTVQSPTTSPYRFTFSNPTSNLTIGPRVVKATLKRTTTTTEMDGSTTSTTAEKKGVAMVVVRPGATHVVDLHVQ